MIVTQSLFFDHLDIFEHWPHVLQNVPQFEFVYWDFRFEEEDHSDKVVVSQYYMKALCSDAVNVTDHY